MKRLVPITRKVNVLIILSLVVGVGAVISFLAYRTNQDLLETTRDSLRRQSELLYQSIKNAMLPGEAPVAVSLLGDIRDLDPTYQVHLFRAGGLEAFSDNQTIAAVNAKLGYRGFKDKLDLPPAPMRLLDDPDFRQAVSEGRRLWVNETLDGRDTFTVYNPLLNLPKCTFCHGSDHTIRGVIRIRADVTELVNKQMSNLAISGGIFVAVVVMLTLTLTLYLHRLVIGPVKEIGSVCATVTAGDFEARVEAGGNDEIGVLGETVNQMVEGLYERFQLSKFVSSSTLKSIQNRDRGAKVELTLFFSDVRSFTSYTERHDPEVVVGRLNALLNTQTAIIHKAGGDVDKYVGDEVFAIFSGENQAERACRAAAQIQREIFGGDEARYDGLDVGIGINTGQVILGMIGSEARADYTVIGDHVNFASRLCSAAKGGEIIIAERTHKAAGNGIKARGPYKVQVKGKQEPQRVYVLEEVL